jgi:hypothetical protein
MNVGSFLGKLWQPGNEYFAGIVSIDIADHSKFLGSTHAIGVVRDALRSLITTQILEDSAALIEWQGDGGFVLFDIGKGGCDAMILFADRVQQLIPWLNRTRGLLNALPHDQALRVRVVCHAGNIRNSDGTNGGLVSDALNQIRKGERDVGRPGHVVLSSKVHSHIADAIKDRCVRMEVPHDQLGQIFVLDGHMTSCTVEEIDQSSIKLKDWIRLALARRPYGQLLYFAYTNELLHEFLAYDLPTIGKVDVKILVRNWLVEREDEDEFNQRRFSGVSAVDNRPIRPWNKAAQIKLRTKQLIEDAMRSSSTDSIDVRFYDGAPMFNGAILRAEDGVRCAMVGVVSWEQDPPDGGSPYKLEQWPALRLDSNDNLQRKLINYFESRFEEMWGKGQTYDELCEREEVDPQLVRKLWGVDNKPVLIVYPHRRVMDRSFPVMAYEDVMALREVEGFLKRHRVPTRLLSVQLPTDLGGEWFPPDALTQINAWSGHILYICSKVVPPTLRDQMKDEHFPYDLRGVGSSTPSVFHVSSRHNYLSPTDRQPPEPRDYSLVAKMKRIETDGFVFVAAGVRAMGTWGAARYLVDGRSIKAIVEEFGENGFAALVSTAFDPSTQQILAVKPFLAPEQLPCSDSRSPPPVANVNSTTPSRSTRKASGAARRRTTTRPPR